MPPTRVQRELTFYTGAAGDDERRRSRSRSTGRAPALSTIHPDTDYAAALAGLGIAGLPSFVVEDALLRTALERVLPEWRLFSATIWAGMPTRKHVPARTRAFIDFLVADLRRRGPRPVARRRRLRDRSR